MRIAWYPERHYGIHVSGSVSRHVLLLAAHLRHALDHEPELREAAPGYHVRLTILLQAGAA